MWVQRYDYFQLQQVFFYFFKKSFSSNNIKQNDNYLRFSEKRILFY